MTLSHNISLPYSQAALLSCANIDHDMASKTEVLKRFSFHYDTPHDNSCLYWSFLFASFLPLVGNEDRIIEKFLSFFGQEHLDKFEKVSELLFSFDGYGVWGDIDCKSFVILHLRKKLADHIIEHQEDYSPYIEDNESIESYALRMKNMHSWGGETEIKVFSELFSVPIFVVSPRLLNVRVFGASQPQERAICLQHNISENHYEFYLQTPFIVKIQPSNPFPSKGYPDYSFLELSSSSYSDKDFELSQMVFRPKAIKPAGKISQLVNEHKCFYEAFESKAHSSLGSFFSDSEQKILSPHDRSFYKTSAFSLVLPHNVAKDGSLGIKEEKKDPFQLPYNVSLEDMLNQYMTLSTTSDIEEEFLKPVREKIAERLRGCMPQPMVADTLQTEILNEFTLYLFKLNFPGLKQDLEVYLRSFIFEILRLVDPMFLPARDQRVKDFAHVFSSNVASRVPNKLLTIFYVIFEDIISLIEVRSINFEKFDKAYDKLIQELYKQLDSPLKDEAMAIIDLVFNKMHKRLEAQWFE
jgi:hypothetical protein